MKLRVGRSYVSHLSSLLRADCCTEEEIIDSGTISLQFPHHQTSWSLSLMCNETSGYKVCVWCENQSMKRRLTPLQRNARSAWFMGVKFFCSMLSCVDRVRCWQLWAICIFFGIWSFCFQSFDWECGPKRYKETLFGLHNNAIYCCVYFDSHNIAFYT